MLLGVLTPVSTLFNLVHHSLINISGIFCHSVCVRHNTFLYPILLVATHSRKEEEGPKTKPKKKKKNDKGNMKKEKQGSIIAGRRTKKRKKGKKKKMENKIRN